MREPADLVAAGRVDDAPLPVRYERARTEIAAAASLDECAEWTSKASALASYARQAKDDSLLAAATRIKARAIRRSGELLREIPAKPGKRTDLEPRGGSSPRLEAAKAAGFSSDQTKQAVRFAKVPATEFEELVESEDPCIDKLEERGTKKKPAPLVDLQGIAPADFNRSLHLLAAMERLAADMESIDPADFIRGVLPSDKKRLGRAVLAIAEWLELIGGRIPK